MCSTVEGAREVDVILFVRWYLYCNIDWLTDRSQLKGSLQTTYSNRLKRAMLPWPWELTVAQAAMARLHRLLVPRLRVHPEPWLMSIDWERLNHSDDEPLCGASRRSWAA